MVDRKLFVTGGSGFVGSHILNQLIKDGFSCIALYRKVPSSINDLEWIQGDLLDPAGYETHLDNISTIVHIAGAVSYQKKDRNKLLYSNYLSTRELVNLALYKQVKNLIFISSASTLIRSSNPLHISVKASGTPVFNSFYAKTKFLAELEILRAAAEGMNVCILYPSLVIGHWNWNQSSMQLFEKVKSGISYYPPGNLGLVGAEDLANIVSRICRNGINNQKILVNAEVWTYREFFNEIALCMNKRTIQKEATYWMAKIMSIKDTAQSIWSGNQSLITNETIKSSFAAFNYDPSLSTQEMNFSYQDIRKLIHEIVLKHVNYS